MEDDLIIVSRPEPSRGFTCPVHGDFIGTALCDECVEDVASDRSHLVTVEVEMSVHPSKEEREFAVQDWVGLREVGDPQEPDEEWIRETVAMRRLSVVRGTRDMTCIDNVE